MSTTIIEQQQELFFRADKLVKEAEEYILSFAGNSLFYYEGNDSDDGDDAYTYVDTRLMPKSDELALHTERISDVEIMTSKFLGYYNTDNLSAILVTAKLTYQQWEREDSKTKNEWEEIKNYILWFEAHDDSEPYEYAEKDIDGWPEEFYYLEQELEVEQQ